MKSFFFDWPIIILVVGWLFGRCRISNAFICLGVMLVISQGLVTLSLVYGDPGFFAAGMIVAAFGVVTSVAVAFATSAPVRVAPIDHVVRHAKRGAQVYQALPPDQKEKLHRGVILGATALARAAGPHVADWLRTKNRPHLAGFVEEGSKKL